jgi:hypothetical protein
MPAPGSIALRALVLDGHPAASCSARKKSQGPSHPNSLPGTGLLLPDENTLGKVTRYEAHLSRQMLQALHTLERLQAARAGQPVPPPAALDVTIEGETGPAVEQVAAALDAG